MNAIDSDQTDKGYTCKLCGLVFTKAPALSRHKLHSCKNNPDRTPRHVKKVHVHTQNLKTENCNNNSNLVNKSSIEVLKEKTSDDSNSIKTVVPSIKKTNANLLQGMTTCLDKIPDHNEESTAIIATPLDNQLLMKILDNQMNQMKSHDALQTQISQLKSSFEKTKPNYFNIEKIQIFMTDPVDFVDVLTKRWGSRQKAVDYIRARVHQKLEGDVELFCNIYLSGDTDTWPISCVDKKNLTFRIAQPNQEPINDPGGIQIHRNFRNAYANTLLRLSNAELEKTFKYVPGSEEYEMQRDILMDEFDLNLFQEKAQDLYQAKYEPFVKKLTIKFKMLEKSLEK